MDIFLPGGATIFPHTRHLQESVIETPVYQTWLVNSGSLKFLCCVKKTNKQGNKMIT